MRLAGSRTGGMIAALVVSLLVLVAPNARADNGSVHTKSMVFAESRGNLTVTGSFTELFDTRTYKRLASGFASTIVVRLYVYRTGVELPVSFRIVRFRVVYDLWDEVYVIRIDGPRGRRNLRLKTRAEALRTVTELADVPLAPLSKIPRGPHHFLGLVVELNPVSQALLAEMRRWLTRPAGSASLDRTSSFFGSFVSIFVNPKVPEADRVLKLRSQPFYRTKR